MTNEPVSPRSYWAELDVDCEHAILRCLKVDSSARFQSAREVAAVFAKYLSVPSARAVSGSLPLRPNTFDLFRGPLEPWRTTTAFAILIAALAGLFGYRWTQLRKHDREGKLGGAVGSLRVEVPLPFVTQPLQPPSVAPGSRSFTLTVQGTGFDPASVVEWNGKPLPTTFQSSGRLTAHVPAENVAKEGTARIRVRNRPGLKDVSDFSLFFVTGRRPLCSSLEPLMAPAVSPIESR